MFRGNTSDTESQYIYLYRERDTKRYLFILASALKVVKKTSLSIKKIEFKSFYNSCVLRCFCVLAAKLQVVHVKLNCWLISG